MPRNLLELLVSNLPPVPHSELTGYLAGKHAANPENTLGCILTHVGFDPTYVDLHPKFIPYAPQAAATPADVCVFAPATATNFVFSGRPLPPNQVYFAKKFGLLAKTHGCNLVALHLPLFEESKSQVITEPLNWSNLMETDVCLMGIPGGRLFAGLSESEMALLFYDPNHLNANGQRYFTSLIMPALIQFYESHADP